MKIYCKDGKIVEVGNVSLIGKGDIVIRINMTYRKETIEEMEKELAEKLGRKVILLDTRFGEIMTLPPKKHPVGAPRRP